MDDYYIYIVYTFCSSTIVILSKPSPDILQTYHLIKHKKLFRNHFNKYLVLFFNYNKYMCIVRSNTTFESQSILLNNKLNIKL